MLLGIGRDIVEIARMRRTMEKGSFLRVLSKQKRGLFNRIPKKRRAKWLVGHFAAKEAITKAVHKEKSYVLFAVGTLADAAGAPTCYIAGLQVEISISHEKGYTITYAAAMKEQVFMYVSRSLCLLQLAPRSWIDTVLVRKEPSAQRYACMKKWSEGLLSHYHVTLDVQFQEQLPKDQPILFVCNHQSEFDMLLQMAVLDLPFTFISKKENEEVSYVVTWLKTLEVILFDREDRDSTIHMLRKATKRLKAKDNLLIFPEGTRSRDDIIHPMQTDSTQPAFMARACIIPVVLKNPYDYTGAMKYKGTFHTRILKPLYYRDYKPLKTEGVTVQLQEETRRVLDET